MASRQLFLASVVLLFVSYAVADEFDGFGLGSFGGCNSWEMGYLSRTCLSPFRYAHMGLWGGSTCMSNQLQCSAASTCWSCINQCRPRLSAGCWGGISTAITSILRSYNFGCSFQQIQSTCSATLPTLAVPAMTGIGIGGYPGIGISGGFPGMGIMGGYPGMGISGFMPGMGMGIGGCQPGIAGCAPAIGIVGGGKKGYYGGFGKKGWGGMWKKFGKGLFGAGVTWGLGRVRAVCADTSYLANVNGNEFRILKVTNSYYQLFIVTIMI